MRLALSTGLTLLLLSAMPMNAVASEQRLGEGHNWGRCLLIVDGKTLISGKCGYRITKGGEFYIAGPRQVYEGVRVGVWRDAAIQRLLGARLERA